MRVLVLGYPLPDPRIDNYNALTAPSFFDYDGIIADPASFTAIAAELLSGEREFQSFDGRPVVQGATTAAAVSAADQFRRRAEETQRYLGAGGTILVFARPNAVQPGVVGFEGCDRFSWLPAPAGMAWGPPFLKAAEGKTVRISAEDHPIAPVLRDYRRAVQVRAVFDDQNTTLRAAGRVLARGGADIPIAMEFAVFGGRVVFLPVIDETGSGRGKLAGRLVEVVAQLSALGDTETEQAWERAIAVPGLEQIEAELDDATQTARAANDRLDAASERSGALRRHRRLLTREGPEFHDAVAEALAMLGFAVTERDGSAFGITGDGLTAFVEAEGSRERVVEWPYVRLQRRLEQQLLSKGETSKGLIVVNGFRGKAPDDREPQFSDQLRNAAENYRYGLVTGATLFTLVQRVLGGAGDDFAAGVRRRLLATPGLISAEHALGEAEEQDAGPIF